MCYPLALFDLDRTVADSFPWLLRVVNTVAWETIVRVSGEGA